MVKKILKIFGIIVITKQLFTLPLPIFNYPLYGYDINTILFYMFIIITIAISLMKICINKKILVKDLFLFLYIFTTFIISVSNWKGLSNFLSDSTLCLMPISIYFWNKICDLKPKFFIVWISIINIIAGVISVLVANRIIKINLWAAENDFVRAASSVNSTIGIGGLIVCLVMLFLNSKPNKFSEKILYFFSFLGSILTVFFSFSRTRLVISIIIIFCLFFYALSKYKYNRHGGIRLAIFFICVFMLMNAIQPDLIDKIVFQMSKRFLLLENNDSSVIYRFEEQLAQFNLFKQYPILGNGWGIMKEYDMYMHNVYTAFLMQSGLMSLFYFFWYFTFLFNFIRKRKILEYNEIFIISFVFQAILFILNFTNGGFVVSGGYFMLLAIFIADVHFNEKI